MNAKKITWYSMTRDLTVQEHEPVALERATQIVDEYMSRASEQFESGEDAIASTMFGFSRSAQDFVEICIHNPNRISFKFEAIDPDVPWFLKPWKRIFQHQEELKSRDSLINRVQDFFLHSSDEILRRLKRKR